MDAARRPDPPDNPDTTRLFAGTDWSATPLGPVAGWPPELATLARLVLRAKSPQHLVWGPQQILIYNDGYIPLLADRHPAAFGRPFREVWGDIWDVVEPNVRQTYAGVSSFYENHPFELDRGGRLEKVWVSFAYTPVEGADGQVLGFHCSFHDGTAAVLAEHQRAADLERLRAMFEQAPGFMALLSGPRHVFTLANEAYGRLVGGRDVIGRSVAEALPEAADQGFVAMLDQAYRSGERFVGSRLPIDLADAHGGTERRYVDFIYQPLFDAAGQPSGIFVQGSDVTASALAEQELRTLTERSAEAANAAEQARARLDALLQAAPVGIGYANLEGELQLVNQANYELWGLYPETRSVEAYGAWKGWWADGSARHGQPLAPQDWGLARALRGEHVPGDLVEIEPFDAPGTRKTVLLRATPVRDAEGVVIGGVVAQMDITDRVRAEAELRESEAKFRTIANAMPQMVWSTRPDGFHDFYNAQWYEFTGTTPGSTDGEGWAGIFHPEDQPRAWARWRHSLATGEPYEIEYRLRHHSGEYRWVLGRALPVRGDDGRILRWMGTCTDIHGQMLAQAALADSEARFRAVADNIPQLAWMTDGDGSIVWYNDRWYAYTGTTPEQMQGWGWRDVHPPAHADRVVAEVQASFAAGQPWQNTYLLRGADGEYRWFLTQVVPLRDAEGRIARWFGTNTDVTAQREAEDALRQADRRKDEFLAMLAHELRNPLAPISTAAELLRLPGMDAGRMREAGTVISRQVRHMTELVDDLLDVSRVTRGLITLDEDVVDLREAAQAAIEQARPLLESRGHALAAATGPAPAWVRGDRTRLTQIISNLLQNAAKYTPREGRIELSVKVEDDEAVVAVRDNGQGIDAAFLPHVFDLFVQGERTPDRAQGGLGIGLALVRSLVALHGGRIGAASDGPGRGSVFTVRLPLTEAPARAPGEAPAGAAMQALSVAVVDDNVDAALTLQALLEAYGHRVHVLHDAASTLALPTEVAVDVYLLDIGLPDLSGHELARRLRADPHRATARLFALTGYGQDSDRRASQSAGFDRHFVKPLDPETLLHALEAAQPACTTD